MRTIVLLLISSILFISCKKDNSSTDTTPPPPPTSSNNITMITTSAVPGEIIIAQANYQLTKDTATVLVNGKAVLGIRGDSNRIFFILPELTQNSTATIHYQNIGVNKQLSVLVGAYTKITQPDQVLNEFITEIDKTIINYKEYENSPYIPLDPAFNNVLKYIKENLALKFATLSIDEKKQLAYTLKANMPNAQDAKMDSLNTSFFFKTEKLFGDPEDEFNENVTNLLTKSTVAKIKMSAGLMLMAGSVFAGPSAPLVALTGSAMFLFGANMLVKAEAESYNNSTNSVVVRTIGAEADYRVMVDTIKLVKDAEQRIIFKGTFRTLSQTDASSTKAYILNFFTAKKIFDEAFAIAQSAYEKCKVILGGLAPQFPQANQPLRQTPASKKLRMESEKLTVKNVSNSAISLTYTRESGALRIKATSSTVADKTPFTFDVEYANPTTGNIVTDKIKAIYTFCDPSKPEPPVITAINTLCATNAAIDVSFTAAGSGVFIGSSYSGWCEPATTCYPVRLEWYDARQANPKWEQAYNGYNVSLISGNVNNGVIRMVIKSAGCTPTPREWLSQGGVRWRVYLMNQCNQRSNIIEI